jgi:hypothetical protein
LAAIAQGPRRGATAPDWLRKYPPLLTGAVALLIALIVLPSSLNLPQSNPSQTLEYAPVPPEDSEDPPPPTGNLAALGLGSSDSIEGASPELPGGTPPALPGKTPTTKSCVIRADGTAGQTEDPLSPPCVADFRGDNGGATYQGVEAEEVRVLIYFQGNYRYTNTCRDPNQVTPDRQYFDLAEPAEENEHCLIRVLRAWQQYFNERYQAFNRFVHFYVYVSGAGNTAEERRADAAENFAKVKPFAVISTAESFQDDYLEVMTRRGVLNFGSFAARDQGFFQQYAPLVWSYLPSLQKQAEVFASYLCTKVAPHPVSFSRNPGENGQPRKYAMWRTADEGHPELIALASEVKRLAAECGMEMAAEATFPSAGYVQDNRYSPRYATTTVAEWKQQGITTVIWPGGLETNFTKQAGQLSYFPEIVALGDGVLERVNSSTFQDQGAWDQAHIVTNVTMVADERTQQCYVAFKQVDPSADDNEILATACSLYPPFRMLFSGIQNAGPRLTPQNVDKGFHAVPRIRSTDPSVPACFYDLGDYTCVKDAMVERWDRTANSGQGCFRATEDGLRYFSGIWPEGDVLAQETPEDLCNEYDDSFSIEPNPPDDPTNF